MVTPKQILKNLPKVMGCPSRSETPSTMMLLGEPIGVRLPPRFAPTTRPHQTSGETPPLTQLDRMGVKVAASGILSTSPEGIPDSHITAI